MNPPFCVDGALAEPLAGTAPHRRVWALVEHPGPWGREAVLDAPWPAPGFGRTLQALTDEADVRVLLARRPDRAGRDGHGDDAGPSGASVVLSRCGPGGWTGTTTLDRREELLGLDWAALAAAGARPPGWTDPGPVWGVCTHGTRDACCARLGRPLAQAFEEAAPGTVREISHSGGHRFAGVAFAVNEGLLYGRVGPQDVASLVQARAGGRTLPRLLRGAVHRTPPQQAAEAALRAHLGEDRVAALVLLDGDELSTWRSAGGATYRVAVSRQPLPDRPASCGKPPEAASAWVGAAVERVAG